MISALVRNILSFHNVNELGTRNPPPPPSPFNMVISHHFLILPWKSKDKWRVGGGGIQQYMYSYGDGVESSKTKQTVLIIEFETLLRTCAAGYAGKLSLSLKGANYL